MKIALIGFGRMGQTIANLAGNKHQIRLIVDHDSNDANSQRANQLDAVLVEDIATADWTDVDVAIEFTHPESVMKNVKLLCENGVNTVIGTTGWYDQMEQVEGWTKEHGNGVLWASNFSIGVHLFWEMVRRGAEVMNAFPEYDAFTHEYHHNQKADSPSGTALSTAKLVLENLDRKTELCTETLSDRPIKPEELHVSSTRGGSVPGTHSVFFDSPADQIEIKHTARNREGFARGAIKCAEWVNGKSGFYSIEDYLKSVL
jgi:4-hydroxy-tetrahydrodipicolinate reductase